MTMALSSFLKPITDRQVNNKDKHMANIEARRSGLTPPAPEVAPEPPGPEVNAGARLGGVVRNSLIPAAGAVGAGIANAAMIVPAVDLSCWEEHYRRYEGRAGIK
jgi:hypothetical protein